MTPPGNCANSGKFRVSENPPGRPSRHVGLQVSMEVMIVCNARCFLTLLLDLHSLGASCSRYGGVMQTNPTPNQYFLPSHYSTGVEIGRKKRHHLSLPVTIADNARYPLTLLLTLHVLSRHFYLYIVVVQANPMIYK